MRSTNTRCGVHGACDRIVRITCTPPWSTWRPRPWWNLARKQREITRVSGAPAQTGDTEKRACNRRTREDNSNKYSTVIHIRMDNNREYCISIHLRIDNNREYSGLDTSQD